MQVDPAPKIRNIIAVIFVITLLIVAVNGWSEIKVPHKLELRVDMQSSVDSYGKVYFDMGSGYREKDSAHCRVVGGKRRQILRFPLPQEPICHLRFDPLKRPGEFKVFGIGLFDEYNHQVQAFDLQTITPKKHIAAFDVNDKRLVAVTKPNGYDPILDVALDFVPLSFTSVYPLEKRAMNVIAENYQYVGRAFFLTLLLTGVAMWGAYSDIGKLGAKSKRV